MAAILRHMVDHDRTDRPYLDLLCRPDGCSDGSFYKKTTVVVDQINITIVK